MATMSKVITGSAKMQSVDVNLDKLADTSILRKMSKRIRSENPLDEVKL